MNIEIGNIYHNKKEPESLACRVIAIDDKLVHWEWVSPNSHLLGTMATERKVFKRWANHITIEPIKKDKPVIDDTTLASRAELVEAPKKSFWSSHLCDCGCNTLLRADWYNNGLHTFIWGHKNKVDGASVVKHTGVAKHRAPRQKPGVVIDSNSFTQPLALLKAKLDNIDKERERILKEANALAETIEELVSKRRMLYTTIDHLIGEKPKLEAGIKALEALM